MIVPKVEALDVRKIHPAPWNPPKRTNPNGIDFQRLLKDIRNFGQSIPGLVVDHPTIEKSFMLVEGHRRWECLKLLNDERQSLEERLPFFAIVKDWPIAVVKERYGVLNNTQCKHTKVQLMGSWLLDPSSVPSAKAVLFEDIVKLVGRDTFERMEQSNRSPVVYQFAQGVAKALQMETNGSKIRTLIHWMLDHKVAGTVRTAMALKFRNGMASEILRAAEAGEVVWFDDAGRLKCQKPEPVPTAGRLKVM